MLECVGVGIPTKIHILAYALAVPLQ